MFDPPSWDKQVQQWFLNKFEPEQNATSELAPCVTRLMCFWSDTWSLKPGFTSLIKDCSSRLCFTLFLPRLATVNAVKLSRMIHPGYKQR